MRISYGEHTLQLPDFLIPGAAQSGTTEIFERLRMHPDIFLPDKKEPMFFSMWKQKPRQEWLSGELIDDWSVTQLDAYARLFAAAGEHQICGEASIWYLYDYETAIRNIQDLYGTDSQRMKVIIVLRHPAERAWNHYLVKCARVKEFLNFEEAIQPNIAENRLAQNFTYSYDYIGFGRYANQVRAWIHTFPHTRIWIYEEFFKDLEPSMRDLCTFLDIPWHPSLLRKYTPHPPGLHGSPLTQRLATIVMRPSGWKSRLKRILPPRLRRRTKLHTLQRSIQPHPIPETIRQKLNHIYDPDIRELENVLQRSLAIWR